MENYPRRILQFSGLAKDWKPEEVVEIHRFCHVTSREKYLRARRRLIYEHPFALRLAALSVICRYFYTLGTLVFTCLALTVMKDQLENALLFLYGIPLVWIWAALSTSGLRCLVCPTPVLKSRRSSKHRTAKRILGSYTLGMAVHVIFARRFRCMHCGTQQRLVDDGVE